MSIARNIKTEKNGTVDIFWAYAWLDIPIDSFLVSWFIPWMMHSERPEWHWQSNLQHAFVCWSTSWWADSNRQWAAWAAISVSLLIRRERWHPALVFQWTNDLDLRCLRIMDLLTMNSRSLNAEVERTRVWFKLTLLLNLWVRVPCWRRTASKSNIQVWSCEVFWPWCWPQTRWCAFARTSWAWSLTSPLTSLTAWPSPHLNNICEPETNLDLWIDWISEDASFTENILSP